MHNLRYIFALMLLGAFLGFGQTTCNRAIASVDVDLKDVPSSCSPETRPVSGWLNVKSPLLQLSQLLFPSSDVRFLSVNFPVALIWVWAVRPKADRSKVIMS